MNSVDVFLARYSANRLVLSGLGVLAGISVLEAFLGWLPYTGIELVFSLGFLVLGTTVTNSVCKIFFKKVPTPESALITALILFFILSPLQSASDALVLLIAGAIAVLSKCIFTYDKSFSTHIFNPAAFAAAVVALTGTGLVSWWVGTPALFLFAVVLGILVVRKTRSFEIVWIFIVVTLLFAISHTLFEGFSGASTSAEFSIVSLAAGIIQFFVATPVIFFATLLLTEAQTMPHLQNQRRLYAALVGILYSIPFVSAIIPFAGMNTLSTSPELSLLIGNTYSFVVEKLKRKTSLFFRDINKLSKDMYEFTFLPSASIKFQAGQYMEWILPHESADESSIHRYFVITSIPGDHLIRFATSMPVESSTFKKELRKLKERSQIFAKGPLGNFSLPKDPNQKILMIAGGAGIASFISMFRTLAQQHERRNIFLIYTAYSPFDFAFQKEIDSVKDSIGLSVLYLPFDFIELSDWPSGVPSGALTAELIQKEVPDFGDRLWCLSGPESQVHEFKRLATFLNISNKSIKAYSFNSF